MEVLLSLEVDLSDPVPWRRLAAAVLTTALRDAIEENPKDKPNWRLGAQEERWAGRRDAKAWIRDAKPEDYNPWAGLLGYDPEVVCEKFKTALDSGSKNPEVIVLLEELKKSRRVKRGVNYRGRRSKKNG